MPTNKSARCNSPYLAAETPNIRFCPQNKSICVLDIDVSLKPYTSKQLYWGTWNKSICAPKILVLRSRTRFYLCWKLRRMNWWLKKGLEYNDKMNGLIIKICWHQHWCYSSCISNIYLWVAIPSQNNTILRKESWMEEKRMRMKCWSLLM